MLFRGQIFFVVTTNWLSMVAELQLAAKVESEESKAMCLVGQAPRSSPGALARAFAALGDVQVRMVSQGASKISFSFVVAEHDADTAVHRLHAAFFAKPGTGATKPRTRQPATTSELSVPTLAVNPLSATAD